MWGELATDLCSAKFLNNNYIVNILRKKWFCYNFSENLPQIWPYYNTSAQFVDLYELVFDNFTCVLFLVRLQSPLSI